MNVFIIPLKSATVAKSWSRVTRLVERTVRSVSAQRSPEFRVVVVCHEIPAIENGRDAKIEFLGIDSPPPRPSIEEQRYDKRLKMIMGLRRARNHGPCHVMYVDADDCVSNRLAGHVADESSAHGWYFRRGYFHHEGHEKLSFARWRFHKWCGSSHIIRLEDIDIPKEPDGHYVLKHRNLAREMRRVGTPLKPLPFPGAVYNLAHGENFHDYVPFIWPENPLLRSLRAAFSGRALTSAIRGEFGLYSLDLPERIW